MPVLAPVLVPLVQPETRLQNEIRLELSRRFHPQLILFRNHNGVRDGITFGLGAGSPDLVGWLSVGGRAIFVGIEVKTPKGRIRPEQEAWLKRIAEAGGIAIVAKSVEDTCAIIQQAITQS